MSDAHHENTSSAAEQEGRLHKMKRGQRVLGHEVTPNDSSFAFRTSNKLKNLRHLTI